MSWRISPIVVLYLLCHSHNQCFADTKCSVTQIQSDQYQALVNRGRTAHAVGNYDEAIKSYKEAYYICDSQVLLYNIAQAYRLSEQALSEVESKRQTLRQAITFYDSVIQIVQDLHDSKSIELHEKAKEFRETSKELLGKLPNSQVVLVPSPQKTPVYKKGWFWGTVFGSLAVMSVGVGLGIYFGTRLRELDSDLGTFPAY